MPTNFIKPFDFKIVLNYFLGNMELLAFAFIITLSFTAAKFQMRNRLFAMLLAVCCSVFAFYLGEVYYFLFLLITGFLVSKMVARFVTWYL